MNGACEFKHSLLQVYFILKNKKNYEDTGGLRQKAKVALIFKKRRGQEGNDPHKSCSVSLN